jgi:hypothetical protein
MLSLSYVISIRCYIYICVLLYNFTPSRSPPYTLYPCYASLPCSLFPMLLCSYAPAVPHATTPSARPICSPHQPLISALSLYVTIEVVNLGQSFLIGAGTECIVVYVYVYCTYCVFVCMCVYNMHLTPPLSDIHALTPPSLNILPLYGIYGPQTSSCTTRAWTWPAQ